MNLIDKITISGMLCTYYKDDPKLLEIVLENILLQTRPLDEMSIVVDGPIPKKNLSIISDFIDKLNSRNIKVKSTFLPVNKGHGAARETALRNCTCEYIAIFDADDIPNITRIEHQFLEINKTFPDVIGGHIQEIDSKTGKTLGVRRVSLTHDEILLDMQKRSPINNMTALISRKALDRIGGYHEVYFNEDYDLWIRLAQAGFRFANVDEILVKVNAPSDYFIRRSGWKYFMSEFSIQKRLLEMHKSWIKFFYQVSIRFVAYIILPNKIRSYLFRKLMRS